MTTQNAYITAKLMEIYEKHKKTQRNRKKTQSQRENDLRPILVPTTLAVLGVLSSCPRVMTMQCWKSKIPPPLSTRRSIIVFLVSPKKRKTTRLSKIPQKHNTQRQVKNEHCTFIPNPQNANNINMIVNISPITAKPMNIYEKHKKKQRCRTKT